MKNKTYLKMLLAGIAIVFVLKPSFSQKGLWYGVSIGVQNTYLRSWSRSEIDAKNVIRPVTSLNMEYQFSSGASIQSGIGYSLLTQNTSKFKNNFNYFTVPIYFKGGSFKEDKRSALSYFCGVNCNFLTSAKNIYQDEKNDIAKYTMKYHQDLAVGFGVKHKIADHIILETYLTGAFGNNINNASFDGFVLFNMNYGALITLKYKLKKRNK